MASRKDNRGRALEKNEYQRENGTYTYLYRDLMGNRKAIYAPDLATLREKEKKIQIAAWHGVDAEEGNSVTLNDVFDRYMSTKFGLKQTTTASYHEAYNRYVRNDFGKRCIKTMKHSDVQAFYVYLIKNKGLSLRTVEHLHVILHPTFELAVDDGILLKNPTKGLFAKIRASHGYSTKRRHALSVEDQRVFLDYIKDHDTWGRYHSIFAVLVGTGLRASELSGLRWDDVDFDKRVINVNHALVRIKAMNGIKEHFEISTTKTSAGNRIVPIMEPVMEAFREEYEFNKKRGFSKYEVDGYKGFILTNYNGTPYTAVRLDEAIKRIVISYNKIETANAERKGTEPKLLPRFSCHILRHTFCTRLCENDVNIKVIQSVMGHGNINITMDIYAEVSEEKKMAEIDKIAENWDVF